MDIKPENIFLTKKLNVGNDACNSDHNKSTQSFLDDGFEDDSDSEFGDEVSFKIGDFGLVAISTGREVEEGDCRYMAPELLNEDIEKDLTKSDIYALGMTLIECVNGTPLPKNGQEWHEIRKPENLSLDGISSDLAALIKKMIDPDPHQRPSASFITQQPEVHTSLDRSRAQLKRQLNSSIAKIKELTEQLKEAEEKRALLETSFMSTTSTADDVVCLQGSLTK
jgi:wee1-like protein kinase